MDTLGEKSMMEKLLKNAATFSSDRYGLQQSLQYHIWK